MRRLEIRVRFDDFSTSTIRTTNIPASDLREPSEIAGHIVGVYNCTRDQYAPRIASVVDVTDIEPERPEPDNIKVLYFVEANLWKFNRYDDDWVAEELQPLPLQDTHPRANYTPEDYHAHEEERARLLGPAELHPVESDKPTHDPVNSPDHYTAGGIEAIDYMKAKSTPEEFAGYLRLNALKYLSRANHKGKTLEDLKKAGWYVNRLIEELE